MIAGALQKSFRSISINLKGIPFFKSVNSQIIFPQQHSKQHFLISTFAGSAEWEKHKAELWSEVSFTICHLNTQMSIGKRLEHVGERRFN